MGAGSVEQPGIEQLAELMPFSVQTGVRLLSATREEVVGTLEWTPERCTAGGVMHGGAIMTLADSCAAVCAYLNLPDGAQGTATIESSTRFTRALRSGTLTATSRPVRVTHALAFLETDLRDHDGRLVASVSQIQTYRYPRE
jgi:1,4-dihydroxy-2-naphthoyl-CoA hydrolase